MKRVTVSPRRLAVAGALAGLAVAGSACNLQWSPYAAKVGSRVISPAQLDSALKQASSNTSFSCLLQHTGSGASSLKGAGTDTYGGSFVAYVLTNLIDAAAARAVVARQGLAEPASARSLARSQVEAAFSSELVSTHCGAASTNLLGQLGPLLSDSFVQLQLDEDALAAHAAKVSLTPAGIAAYESAHPAVTRQSCLSGVFVRTLGAAGTVRAKLAAGASMSSIIAKYAPSQAASGATLGCYTSGQLASISPAIDKAVSAAAVGSVAGPVAYQSAYVVMVVTSRPFEPVVAALSQIFTSNSRAFSSRITSEVRRTSIEVNPQYGRWSHSTTGPSLAAAGFGGRVQPNRAPGSADLLNGAALNAPSSTSAPIALGGSNGG